MAGVLTWTEIGHECDLHDVMDVHELLAEKERIQRQNMPRTPKGKK